ncbi:MAG: flavin reductase [Actinomycetales bacterium]|nr:MAG: flavin reductase [Actinomycetales bacterium]
MQKKGADKFEGLSFERTPLNSPILDGASVIMECSTYQIFDTPDHALIIGELKSLQNNQKPPLLYLHSAFENSSVLTR